MVNFKKMDEKDFVFVKAIPNKIEELEFSEFLKKRKIKKQARTTIYKKPVNVV